MSAPMLQRSPATSEYRRRKVTAMTRAGLSAPQIAQQLGITERSVVRIRKACGVAKPPPRRVTEEELAAAKVLLEDGASRAEAARSIGRNSMTLARAFPDMHWTRRQQDEYLSDRRRWRKLVAS